MKRDNHTLPLGIADELLIDNFAGGGGASTGIEQAFGRPVDVAINHDGEALAMHAVNHPGTKHYKEDVFTVHPGFVTQQQPIGLAWFSPDCFPANTMILTDHGYRPIQDIREGDQVLTHAGQYRRVYATMSARKPVHEVNIQGVPPIKVTAEHPFFAREMTNVWDNSNRRYKRTLGAPNWVKATDLRDGPANMNAAGGDRHFCATPCVFPALPIPGIGGRGLDIDERLMWLAGRYVGDGWSRLTEDRAELVITCGKAEAEELAQKIDVWPRKSDRSKYGELAWHQRDTATAYQFSTSHRGLVEWLRTQFGHGGADKSFPAWALGCDEKLRKALLDGYVSADGSNQIIKSVDVVETVTISRALAFSTKSVAESLGFTAQVFSPIQNSASIAGRAVTAKSIYRVRWRPAPLRHQTVREGLHNWSRVQRVSKLVSEEEVFNISVEEDETYIADGIVVHNCKHHSKAKGGKPREKKIRGLAWVCLKWGTFQMPRAIAIENVEEFQDWGPLDEEGSPIKVEKGRTFRAFVDALTTGLDRNHPDVPEIFEALGADFPMNRLYAGLGYKVEWRILRACDYGTPTIRKRLFIFARRDGLPIVWPEATHGDPKSPAVKAGELLPYRTAAECIDWSIPCPSIFERSKPLKEATLRRIAKGVMKFVVNSADPFIVSTAHSTTTGRGPNVWPMDEPLRTTTSSNDKYLVVPSLMHTTHQGADRNGQVTDPLATVTGANRGEQALVTASLAPFITEHANASTQRNMSADEPLRTQCAEVKGGHFAVVAATLVDAAHGEESPNGVKRWGVGAHDIEKPLGTVTASGGNQALVSATLVQTGYGERPGQAPRAPGLDKPLGTVVAGGGKHALVSAMLAKHYGGVVGTGVNVPFGTVTTSDHHSVVTSHLVKLRNNQFGQAVDEPAPTLTAGGGHVGEVRAFLVKYYSEGGQLQECKDPLHTIPTKERFGLVTVQGEEYQIVDIGMRMLTPRELARAQGFPDDYILAPVVNGKPLSKTAQVRMIGNSVCPPLAKAFLAANFTHEREIARVA